jgi:hypothetical protein
MRIAKIVSGGQTGADRGGLDAAIYCKLPYGGWIPKGRRAEDGKVPADYGDLRETGSDSYLVRTEANVADSDATLVLTCGLPVGGSMRTCAFAQKHKRPYLVVNLAADRKQATKQIIDWMTSLPLPECTLNVAGSRESKVHGIHEATMAIMIDVISRVNGHLFYPLNPP